MSRHLLRPALRHTLHHAPAPAAPAGAWTPTDLGATLKGWWDFSDASTLFTDAGTTPVSADGQAIYQANDKSGSNLHLTQATAANRPLYKTAVANGQSVARFDGVNDVLFRAAVTGSALVGTDAGTFVLAMKQTGTNARNTPFRLFETDTNNVRAFLSFDDVFYWDFGNSTAGQGRITGAQSVGWDDTWHVVVCYRSGANSRIYVDGGTPVVASTTLSDALDNTASGNMLIGAMLSTGANMPLNGDIGVLLACNTGLSVANLNAAGGYVAARFGITWTAIT